MTPDDDARAAKLQELLDAVERAEAAQSAAEDREQAIMDEPGKTPEEEADISRRVNEMQDELVRLQEAAAEADREYKAALWEDDDDDDDDNGESLSLGGAKDIWLSKGMDEDYTFGYSEEELRREAGLD